MKPSLAAGALHLNLDAAITSKEFARGSRHRASPTRFLLGVFKNLGQRRIANARR